MYLCLSDFFFLNYSRYVDGLNGHEVYFFVHLLTL